MEILIDCKSFSGYGTFSQPFDLFPVPCLESLLTVTECGSLGKVVGGLAS